MISLALFSSKPRSPSDIGEAVTPAGEGKGANGAFSAVLAALGGQQAASEGMVAAAASSDTAAQDAALVALESGIALPASAETGKTLPDVAAAALKAPHGKGADTPEQGADAEAEDTKDAAGIVAATALTTPLLQFPPMAVTPDASAAAQAKAAPAFARAPSPATAKETPVPSAAIPAPAKGPGDEHTATPLTALHVAPEAQAETTTTSSGSTAAQAKAVPAFAPAPSPDAAERMPLVSAAMPAPAKPTRPADERAATPWVALHAAPEADATGEQASAPVALHVAPEADTERFGTGDTKTSPEPRGRNAMVEALTLKTASPDVAPQTPSAAFTQVPQAENAVPGRPFETAKPAFQADALQDLTRIVDRLAAAREAFTPAAAALAVKHADFGELSLRFDQQRDGHLAVQLSAADPDAHRAVAAAVSERGAAAPADSHTGSSQSQAQARGGVAAERDGNGSSTAGGNAPRQGQPQQRDSARQNGGPDGGAQRAGIFA